MPLDPQQLAPTAFPFRMLLQLESTAGIVREVSIAASDVVVTLGPVYQADQSAVGGASVTWNADTVASDSLAVPPNVADGDQVLLLPIGTTDAVYQPPGQGARSFWVAPFEGSEGGWIQVAIDRVARGGA